MARTLANIEINGEPLKLFIYGHLFSSWLSPYSASLAYALTWIAGWFLVLSWMYKRRIIIKV
jgi:predicted acyltransferase